MSPVIAFDKAVEWLRKWKSSIEDRCDLKKWVGGGGGVDQ